MDAHFDARSARSDSMSPRPESWQMQSVIIHPASGRSTPAGHSIRMPSIDAEGTLADEPRSSFSPISPKFAPIPRWQAPPKSYDVEMARTRSAPLPPKAPRKCSDILFSWRIGGFRKPRSPPPTFETWGPSGDLKITTVKPRKRDWRQIFGWTLLVLLILYLLGNAVYVDIRIANGSLGGSATPTAAATVAALSTAATQCLFEFNLSAPTAPTMYPCSTCTTALAAIPTAYLHAHADDAQVASDAQQFCGLQALFTASGSSGSAALENVGWMLDNSYCTWSGVTCDGSARVTTLSMAFPAVPTTLPDGIGALTALTSLQLVGNGTIPAGPLPASLGKATQLVSLHLEATGLEGPIADSLLADWGNLAALTLIRNQNMGTSLPISLGENALQTLIVNQQGLQNFILLSSSNMAASLTTLDLSANALSGPVYALFSAFSSLKSLRLSDNDFTGPLPTLPTTLQTLTLDHNPHFGDFTLPPQLCDAPALTTCDMQATAFSNQTTVPSCGVCQF